MPLMAPLATGEVQRREAMYAVQGRRGRSSAAYCTAPRWPAALGLAPTTWSTNFKRLAARFTRVPIPLSGL